MGLRGRLAKIVCLLCLAALPRLSPAADESDFSPWDVTLSTKVGAGNKDNILLSDFNKEASLFTLTSVDFFAYRFPIDGWEFTSFLSGEDRRYWQSSTVDKEQLLIASTDLKRKFNDSWKAGINARYVYTDQIFDASIAEGFPLRVQAKMHQFSGGPSVRWDLPGKRRLEASAELERENFEGRLLDDSWQIGPKLVFGQEYGKKSDFTATVQWLDRVYDHRRAPGAGEALHFMRTLTELGVRHNWDEKKTWTSRARAGLEWNQDNGSSFYDYRRWRLSHDLTYSRGSFEATAQAKWLHYEYSRQPSLLGTVRRRTELVFGARAEQGLTKRLKIFADYEYEWVMDSDYTDRYRAQTVTAGLDIQIK